MSLYDNSQLDNKGLSSLTLRIVAMVLTVMYTFRTYLAASGKGPQWMNYLCWPAMLIFSFLLAEGILRTRDKWIYFVRLLLFALLTEVMYNKLVFGYRIDTGSQNVLFTIALCYCLLYFIDYIRIRTDNYAATVIAEMAAAALGIRLSGLLNLQMGRFAVIASILCYISVRVTYSGAFRFISIGLLCLYYQSADLFIVTAAGSSFTLPVQMAAFPALLLIHFYKGKRGPNQLAVRYASYLFYPLLIALTYILQIRGFRLWR